MSVCEWTQCSLLRNFSATKLKSRTNSLQSNIPLIYSMEAKTNFHLRLTTLCICVCVSTSTVTLAYRQKTKCQKHLHTSHVWSKYVISHGTTLAIRRIPHFVYVECLVFLFTMATEKCGCVGSFVLYVQSFLNEIWSRYVDSSKRKCDCKFYTQFCTSAHAHAHAHAHSKKSTYHFWWLTKEQQQQQKYEIWIRCVPCRLCETTAKQNTYLHFAAAWRRCE